MEVDTGVTRTWSRIADNSDRPVVWHGVTVVVEACGYIVGNARIYAENRAGSEVPRQMIDTDEVESMMAIVVRSAIFLAQVIVIRGKRKHPARIVHGLGKRVLAEK